MLTSYQKPVAIMLRLGSYPTFDVMCPVVDVATLNACTLTGSGLKRESKLHLRHRPEGYEEDFDSNTLWYDAIQTDHGVQLICPKLNNLASAIRSARWTIDEEQVHLRRIHFCRFHDTIEVMSARPKRRERISIQIGSWFGYSNIAQPESRIFSKRNTVFLMNKNNHLSWITSFIRFHIYHHGLEAIVLIDNSSTLYNLQDLQDAICKTDLRVALIIPAPFRFGPRIKQLEKPYLVLDGQIFYVEQYLQTALLNIARLRYLSKARAVLQCDIDELAYTPRTTIFDLAVKNPFGIASMAAIWRYSNPMDKDPTRHSAHRFRHVTISELCHAKYCIVPSGIISHFPLFWNLHWLELEQHENSLILSLLSYRFNHALNYLFKISSLLFCPQGKFWHCRSTTTGWTGFRKANPSQGQLIVDPELCTALDAVFSPLDSCTSGYVGKSNHLHLR